MADEALPGRQPRRHRRGRGVVGQRRGLDGRHPRRDGGELRCRTVPCEGNQTEHLITDRQLRYFRAQFGDLPRHLLGGDDRHTGAAGAVEAVRPGRVPAQFPGGDRGRPDRDEPLAGPGHRPRRDLVDERFRPAARVPADRVHGGRGVHEMSLRRAHADEVHTRPHGSRYLTMVILAARRGLSRMTDPVAGPADQACLQGPRNSGSSHAQLIGHRSPSVRPMRPAPAQHGGVHRHLPQRARVRLRGVHVHDHQVGRVTDPEP